jgi:2'-5' RNA ligase
MRLFIAIPLADEVMDELSAIRERLRQTGHGLRWPQPETWHITLQFLGETPGELYAGITERLRGVRAEPVPVALEGLGFFERAGIFHAGVKHSLQLIALQRQVMTAMSLCGFAPETRPFHPHITLARSKGRDPGDGLHALQARIQKQPRFSLFVAREFLLYESFLGPGGSRYEVRERFTLSAS